MRVLRGWRAPWRFLNLPLEFWYFNQVRSVHAARKIIRRLPKSWPLLLASFMLPIAIVVAVKAWVHLPRPTSTAPVASQSGDCQTIIADPKPPVNVRSSPVVANDNIMGRLPNGVSLIITDENEGWLKISSPVQGWVYKELTVTSCGSFNSTGTSAQPSSDPGTRLMAIATQQYQAGNIQGAIALAKTVPADSPVYPLAMGAASQWQTDWNRAESEYYSAQKALRDGNWEDVLSRVENYPNIRFWKEKLAGLVKQAIAQQKLAANKKEAVMPPAENSN
jgi:hypothetical protein